MTKTSRLFIGRDVEVSLILTVVHSITDTLSFDGDRITHENLSQFVAANFDKVFLTVFG